MHFTCCWQALRFVVDTNAITTEFYLNPAIVFIPCLISVSLHDIVLNHGQNKFNSVCVYALRGFWRDRCVYFTKLSNVLIMRMIEWALSYVPLGFKLRQCFIFSNKWQYFLSNDVKVINTLFLSLFRHLFRTRRVNIGCVLYIILVCFILFKVESVWDIIGMSLITKLKLRLHVTVLVITYTSIHKYKVKSKHV